MLRTGVFQVDENDCGAAALATVLKFLKKNIPLYKVKQHVSHSSIGSSIFDISNGSKSFGLIPTELTGSPEELSEAINSSEVDFPFIAHVSKEDGKYHFITVIKKEKNKYVIFDPAQGSKKIKDNDFYKIWTGNLITFKKHETFIEEIGWINFFKSFYILKDFRKYLYVTLFLTFLVSLVSIVSANLYQVIVDTHIMGSTQNLNVLTPLFKLFDLSNIKYLLLFFVAFMIVQNIFSMLIEIILTKIGEKLEKKISIILFEKIFSLEISFYHGKRTGDFLTRLQDIESIVNYLSVTTLKFITSVIMGVIGFIVLANIQFQLFLLMFLGLVLYMVISIFAIPKLSILTKSLIEKKSLLYSNFKENVDTMESVKVIQQEPFFLRKLVQTSYNFIKLKKENSIFISLFNFMINNVDSISNGLILYMGINLILDNNFSLGGFMAFQSLMSFFISPVKELVNIQAETQRYIISYERIQEFIEENSENYDDLDIELPLMNDVSFKNVTFSYNTKDNVIENFTKTFKKGTKVYIEGKNGSGKTTLVKLLNSILTPSEGEIFLGEHSYSELPVNIIRSNVVYSTQNNYIFNGTIKENLFLNNKKREKILSNLVRSGVLDNVLFNMDNGWDTVINESGTNLSEGQKQIIGICRLLIMNAPIMIFDESISKIDERTQEKLIDFIFENFKDNTCIFIEHGSKIKERCDEVINLGS